MRATLLTGGTGFVGLQVLRHLLKQEKTVKLVIREGKHQTIVPHDFAGVVVATPDLFAESSEWWSHVCSGVDTIIHCAWYADAGNYLHSQENLDCLIGTLKLAQGAATAGVRRFVGIGTCVEYDLSGGILSINTPLRPHTMYGAAKAATFTMLSQWLSARNIEFAWCRLFNLYGEGEDPRRLAAYVRAKLIAGDVAELTSGHQIRDFLDVADAGKLIIEIATGAKQGAFNICSGVPVTVREFAESLADLYGGRDLLKFGARPDNPLEAPIVCGEM